jgi:alkylation response protein AidB-like acyl-CoA dehydrogenase
MDASFTGEQEELRGAAREFLAATAEPTWTQLAELGWTGVSVPEEHGGAGLGFLEEAVLAEELGRTLTPGPWLTTTVLLPALPPAQQSEVAAGEASWALALDELVAGLDAATRVAIVGGDGIWELEGFNRNVLATMDETRPLGVVVGGAAGMRLADSSLLPTLRARLHALLALEAAAVGARALELAVEYVSARVQFGRTIGVYQAISHPLASSYAELELARSLALWAAWAVAEGEPYAPVAAAAAKSQSAEAAVAACERSIQAHGGIGFTWEHVLHRLYKRAQGIQTLDASPAQLRAEVATALLDGQGGDLPWTA